MKRALMALSMLMAVQAQASDLIAHQSKINQQLTLATQVACNPALIKTVQKVLSESINNVCKLNYDRENRSSKCSAAILTAVTNMHPTLLRELFAVAGNDAITPKAKVHLGGSTMVAFLKQKAIDPNTDPEAYRGASLQVSIQFGQADFQKIDMSFLASEAKAPVQKDDEEISDRSEVQPIKIGAIDDIRIAAVPACSLDGKNQLAQVMTEICNFQDEIIKGYNLFRVENKPFSEKINQFEASIKAGTKYRDIEVEYAQTREASEQVALKLNLLGVKLKKRYPILFGRQSYYVDNWALGASFEEAELGSDLGTASAAAVHYQRNWASGVDDLSYVMMVDATGEKADRSAGVYYQVELPRKDGNPRFYDPKNQRQYETDRYESQRLCFGK